MMSYKNSQKYQVSMHSIWSMDSQPKLWIWFAYILINLFISFSYLYLTEKRVRNSDFDDSDNNVEEKSKSEDDDQITGPCLPMHPKKTPRLSLRKRRAAEKWNVFRTFQIIVFSKESESEITVDDVSEVNCLKWIFSTCLKRKLNNVSFAY